ncbi:hypothetical protein ElyMa_006605500 [Elysia marginata]|uniref:Lipocalin/cytosolic fatty-acid binding domain-containing protein n=1 Tax=Elysia marginata TaxID=1093978 RepID=A0AAV4IDZ5_9GAST|nr:hypothetical protein ElyMa_006605500 [Elysia marginata]
MMFLAAVLVIVSVMSTSAQQSALCKPPSFTARNLGVSTSGFQLAGAVDLYNDADGQLSLSEDRMGGKWSMYDGNDLKLYIYDPTDGCTVWDMTSAWDALNDEISKNGQLLASYALSNNAGSYDAYYYTNGNITMRGLYDSNCLAVVSTVNIDGVPASMSILTNVVIDNPDLSQISARQQEAAFICN